MRHVYRIDLSNSYYLRGVLLAKGNGEVEGRLVDISSLGASLVFYAGVDPELAVGKEVKLSFRVPGSPKELETSATVRAIAKSDGFIRYGFQFDDFENFNDIPLVLRAVFNRRRAPRVTPEDPATARISGDKGSVDGKLVDFSVCGLCVEIPFHTVGAFDCGAGVELSFSLPGGSEPVRIKGSVRDRRLVGPAIHLGIEYQEDAATDARSMEAIEDYVASREMSPDYVPG